MIRKTFLIYSALIVLGLALLCFYIWLATKPSSAEVYGKGRAPYPVVTIHPITKPMPIVLEESGTVEAKQSVSIFPQASGILRKIYFNPGQQVNQGQLLFELDSGVYATALDQARANLVRDKAQLAALQAAKDRYAALAKLEYVTLQQSDDAKAAAEAQKAVVVSDAALMKQAEIQLGYTQIRAPIAGKTSHITIHAGDLVTANSASPMVVINQLDPVLVDFNVPQDRLTEVNYYQHQGTLKFEIYDENKGQLLAKGKLASINNNVDSQTGRVALKAAVSNSNHVFLPGQFVNVRIVFAIEPKAIVIPNSVVQVGQQGHYVYLVKQNKAVIQPIEISRQIQQETVVAKGLKGDEVIIKDVPVGLAPGRSVQIVNSP